MHSQGRSDIETTDETASAPPAQTTGSFAEYEDASAAWENQMDPGSLAMGLQQSQMGMGPRPLVKVDSRLAVTTAIILLGLAGCGRTNSKEPTQSESTPSGTANGSPGQVDLTDTDADISGVKGGETYDEYKARRDGLNGSAGSYEGYGCTEDCSGHQAGYEWAEAHSVTDASDCGGDSWSFQEGCVAYAQEQSGGDSGSAASSPDDQSDDATKQSDDDDDPSDGN